MKNLSQRQEAGVFIHHIQSSIGRGLFTFLPSSRIKSSIPFRCFCADQPPLVLEKALRRRSWKMQAFGWGNCEQDIASRAPPWDCVWWYVGLLQCLLPLASVGWFSQMVGRKLSWYHFPHFRVSPRFFMFWMASAMGYTDFKWPVSVARLHF